MRAAEGAVPPPGRSWRPRGGRTRHSKRGITMRVALFCHSLLSDWNHGNAHFLRGVVTELLARRHDVRVYEPRDAWSAENLAKDHGEKALDLARHVYPRIRPKRYDL